MITEWITGIENGAIKLWELGEYLTVSQWVTMGLNVMVVLVIAIVILSASVIVDEWRLYNMMKQK